MTTRCVDTHVHLLLSKRQSSPDWQAIGQVLEMASISGLDALCITEHVEADGYASLMQGLFVENQMGGYLHGENTLCVQGVCLFPAAELELANKTNVGVHTDLQGLLALERSAGAYTLAALHDRLKRRGKPFKLVAHHVLWPGKTCDDLEMLGRYIHAIEVPAKDMANAPRYVALAEALKLATTGGSDAHTFIQVGAGYTVFEQLSDASPCTAEQWVSTRQSRHEHEPNTPRLVAMSNIYRQSLMNR